MTERLPLDRRGDYGCDKCWDTGSLLIFVDCPYCDAAERHPKEFHAKRDAERDRYRNALEQLMQFGKRLMGSDVMEERGIGACICEGARVVENA